MLLTVGAKPGQGTPLDDRLAAQLRVWVALVSAVDMAPTGAELERPAWALVTPCCLQVWL